MHNNYDSVISRLIDEGWWKDHWASCRDYRPSGTVSTMKSKQGYEYCRVHLGKTCHKGPHTYQQTIVMRRAIK